MTADEFFVEDEPRESIEAAFGAGRRVVTRRPVSSRQIGAESQEPGRFELFMTTDGEFCFRLRAANGVIVATSPRYSSKSAALEAIASVKAMAAAAPVDSMAG